MSCRDINSFSLQWSLCLRRCDNTGSQLSVNSYEYICLIKFPNKTGTNNTVTINSSNVSFLRILNVNNCGLSSIPRVITINSPVKKKQTLNTHTNKYCVTNLCYLIFTNKLENLHSNRRHLHTA